MKDIKLKLLLAGTILQVVGFITLIINFFFAVAIFTLSGLSFFAVFIIIIIERIKEKEEDKKNDYRNY